MWLSSLRCNRKKARQNKIFVWNAFPVSCQYKTEAEAFRNHSDLVAYNWTTLDSKDMDLDQNEYHSYSAAYGKINQHSWKTCEWLTDNSQVTRKWFERYSTVTVQSVVSDSQFTCECFKLAIIDSVHTIFLWFFSPSFLRSTQLLCFIHHTKLITGFRSIGLSKTM